MSRDAYTQSVDSTLSPLGQTLTRLSTTNTQFLLSEASRLSHSRHADAVSTLIRLRKLNPVIASLFCVKSDVLSDLQLRIITSRPATAGDISSFIIISYCWHYQDWSLAPAAQPVAPGWEISKPMVEAIMALRLGPQEGVWMDKLCINQSDTKEKQKFIGAMDIIYRSARRMLILLEDVQLSREEEAAGTAYASFYADLCRKVREGNFDEASKVAFVEEYFPKQEEILSSEGQGELLASIKFFIMKILGARWFSRAWCAHESRVVPHGKENNPLLLCYALNGRVISFEFRCVHYIATYLQQSPSEPEIPQSYSDLQQQCSKIQRLLPQSNPKVSEMQHLYNVMTSGCLKKGDLISIALNTSKIPLLFTGDIHLVEDVALIFSILIIATNDLTPLIMNGEKIRIVDSIIEQRFISWLSLPADGVLRESTPLRLADSITGITRDYIELDLILFPCLPRKPSSDSIQIAERLIEENNLYDLVQSTSPKVEKSVQFLGREIHHVKGDNSPLSTFLCAWIAHSIDCGLGWAAGFPKLVMLETDEGRWVHGIAGQNVDHRLTKAAESLHQQLTGGPGTDSNPGSIKADQINDLKRFLTCILDPKFTLLAPTLPRCLPCGSQNYAFTSRISNRSWIAVPVSISHLPLWEHRAWVIEPHDPVKDSIEDPSSHLPYLITPTEGGAQAPGLQFPLLTSDSTDQRRVRNNKGIWKLRTQQQIVGPNPLIDYCNSLENGRPVLLRKQRVYGAEDYDWAAISAVVRELKAHQAGKISASHNSK